MLYISVFDKLSIYVYQAIGIWTYSPYSDISTYLSFAHLEAHMFSCYEIAHTIHAKNSHKTGRKKIKRDLTFAVTNAQ